MDEATESWWDRHKTKIYTSAGILLGGALTIFLLSRMEDPDDVSELIEEDEAPELDSDGPMALGLSSDVQGSDPY